MLSKVYKLPCELRERALNETLQTADQCPTGYEKAMQPIDSSNVDESSMIEADRRTDVTHSIVSQRHSTGSKHLDCY